jgi:hypothetical protein
MAKIIIILVAVAILIALVVLFVYLIKSMVAEKMRVSATAKNREAHLKKNPAAWHFINALAAGIAQIEATEKPRFGGATWEAYGERHERVLRLLRRMAGYIEANPNDVFRIQDVEHILPAAQEFFRGYHHCLSFGADTAGGKEYIAFVQEGLDNIEKILNDYIGLLFQNKSVDIRAEIDVMLTWYGNNKGSLEDFPKKN